MSGEDSSDGVEDLTTDMSDLKIHQSSARRRSNGASKQTTPENSKSAKRQRSSLGVTEEDMAWTIGSIHLNQGRDTKNSLYIHLDSDHENKTPERTASKKQAKAEQVGYGKHDGSPIVQHVQRMQESHLFGHSAERVEGKRPRPLSQVSPRQSASGPLGGEIDERMKRSQHGREAQYHPEEEVECDDDQQDMRRDGDESTVSESDDNKESKDGETELASQSGSSAALRKRIDDKSTQTSRASSKRRMADDSTPDRPIPHRHPASDPHPVSSAAKRRDKSLKEQVLRNGSSKRTKDGSTTDPSQSPPETERADADSSEPQSPFTPHRKSLAIAHNIDNKLLNKMKEPIKVTPKKACEHCYVYCFILPDHEGHHKIGYTNDLDERKKQIASRCEIRVESSKEHDNDQIRFKFAPRVESLVHLELMNERRKLNCKSDKCKTNHGEYFKVEERRAMESIDKFRRWIIECAPYVDLTGELRASWMEKVKRRIDEASDERTKLEVWLQPPSSVAHFQWLCGYLWGLTQDYWGLFPFQQDRKRCLKDIVRFWVFVECLAVVVFCLVWKGLSTAVLLMIQLATPFFIMLLVHGYYA